MPHGHLSFFFSVSVVEGFSFYIFISFEIALLAWAQLTAGFSLLGSHGGEFLHCEKLYW